MNVEIDGVLYVPKDDTYTNKIVRVDTYRGYLITITTNHANAEEFHAKVVLEDKEGSCCIDTESVVEGIKMARMFINGYLHHKTDYTVTGGGDKKDEQI